MPFVKMFFDQFGYFSPITTAIYHVRCVFFTLVASLEGIFLATLNIPLANAKIVDTRDVDGL